MATFTVKSVLDQATFLLKDDSNVRWTRTQLLSYVNEAALAIVQMLPDANRKRMTLSLSKGTHQTLPEGATVLFSVECNVDSNGTEYGPVRLATRSIMDAMMWDWRSVDQSATVENYIYDIRDGREFDVFPPNDGKGKISVTYSCNPTKVTKETDLLPLEDEYQQAFLHYVMYRCFLLDSDSNTAPQFASMYYQQFTQALGIQDTNAKKMSALTALEPGKPVAENGGTE